MLKRAYDTASAAIQVAKRFKGSGNTRASNLGSVAQAVIPGTEMNKKVVALVNEARKAIQDPTRLFDKPRRVPFTTKKSIMAPYAPTKKGRAAKARAVKKSQKKFKKSPAVKVKRVNNKKKATRRRRGAKKK